MGTGSSRVKFHRDNLLVSNIPRGLCDKPLCLMTKVPATELQQFFLYHGPFMVMRHGNQEHACYHGSQYGKKAKNCSQWNYIISKVGKEPPQIVLSLSNCATCAVVA